MSEPLIGPSEIIGIVSAAVAVAAAIITAVQIPRPRIVMVPPYSDDLNPGQTVLAELGFQNRGSGPALDVKLETIIGGKWAQTRASEYLAALQPGEIFGYRAQALIDGNTQPRANYASGLGGTLRFNGLKLRLSRRSRFGWRVKKVFDADKLFPDLGRATKKFSTVNLTDFTSPNI